MKDLEYVVANAWEKGMKLKSLVRHLKAKSINFRISDVITLYRSFYRDNSTNEQILSDHRKPIERPHADDWIELFGSELDSPSGVFFSASLKRYWSNHTNRLYDEISASHNGIIGTGSWLKKILKIRNIETQSV